MNIIRLFSTNASVIQRINCLHNSLSWKKLVQFNLSDIGEGIAEVQVKEWHVKVGDEVNEFDEICAVQSDKASVTITSRYHGIIRKLYFHPDDIAKVGQPLVEIEIPDEEDEKQTPITKADTIKDEQSSKMTKINGRNQHEKILASPAVRRLIRMHGLDSLKTDGSGPNGRIMKEDIYKLVKGKSGDIKGVAAAPLKASKLEKLTDENTSSSDDDDEGNLVDKIVPIRGYSRAMIKTMTEALEIPHFGYGDEIVANELVKAREELSPIGEKKGVKLSYMPFIIKATSMALSEFPILNSSLDQSKENLIYKRFHNISFAMDTADGLAVPNIKNCQMKNIWEIAIEMNKLMERGKQKRFTQEDLINGTFTLSNIGSIGGIYMNPVILPPQVAIGAIGKIGKIPKLKDENADDEEYEPTIETQNVMNIFWAADHRVIDGATMARFSNRFKQFLENPWTMLAQLR